MELDFLSEVLKYITSFGGLGKMAQIAGGLMLVVHSLKVSFFEKAWNGLGWAKVLVAPALGLVAGLIMVQPFNLAAVSAYVLSGAGAVLFHQFLAGLKQIPNIKSMWAELLDVLIESLKKSK